MQKETERTNPEASFDQWHAGMEEIFWAHIIIAEKLISDALASFDKLSLHSKPARVPSGTSVSERRGFSILSNARATLLLVSCRKSPKENRRVLSDR